MKKFIMKTALVAVLGLSMVSCKSTFYQVYDVDYDWATGLWKELCKGLKMEELIDMVKNVSFIDEYTLDIKLK